MSYLNFAKIIASLVKVKDSFKNLLKGSTDVQDALEKIDDALVPATQEKDGLLSSTDKTKIDNLDGEIDERLGSLEQTIVDSLVPATQDSDGLMSSIDKTKLDNLDVAIDENLTDVLTKIDDIYDVIEDGGIGHISLTSGYGTYSFESNLVEKEFTIQHGLNSYNLTVTIMFMNDEGYWENIVAPITFLDENSLFIELTEPKEIIVHINAVEYFFNYQYENTNTVTEHIINHGLKSFNLLFNILIFDTVEGYWKNDLAKLVYIDENTCKLTLTDASPCKVNFIRL